MSESLPSGMVAFLFTDVEGSTRRWEESPDAMAGALSIHDGVLTELITDHGGHVFSTTGDAFCAAFRSVVEAARAAAEAQQRLIDVEVGARLLQVRMAIHAGETVERNRNYFGPVLNRTARLMSIGHGGQVLVSQAAASLLSRFERSTSKPHRLWQFCYKLSLGSWLRDLFSARDRTHLHS